MVGDWKDEHGYLIQATRLPESTESTERLRVTLRRRGTLEKTCSIECDNLGRFKCGSAFLQPTGSHLERLKWRWASGLLSTWTRPSTMPSARNLASEPASSMLASDASQGQLCFGTYVASSLHLWVDQIYVCEGCLPELSDTHDPPASLGRWGDEAASDSELTCDHCGCEAPRFQTPSGETLCQSCAHFEGARG
jgi:hypothetical protein